MEKTIHMNPISKTFECGQKSSLGRQLIAIVTAYFCFFALMRFIYPPFLSLLLSAFSSDCNKVNGEEGALGVVVNIFLLRYKHNTVFHELLSVSRICWSIWAVRSLRCWAGLS